MRAAGSSGVDTTIDAMRPPMERPPSTSRSAASPVRSASAAAASRVVASSTGGRSGALRPAARYGKSKRSEGMPTASSASATATSAGAVPIGTRAR